VVRLKASLQEVASNSIQSTRSRSPKDGGTVNRRNSRKCTCADCPYRLECPRATRVYPMAGLRSGPRCSCDPRGISSTTVADAEPHQRSFIGGVRPGSHGFLTKVTHDENIGNTTYVKNWEISTESQLFRRHPSNYGLRRVLVQLMRSAHRRMRPTSNTASCLLVQLLLDPPQRRRAGSRARPRLPHAILRGRLVIAARKASANTGHASGQGESRTFPRPETRSGSRRPSLSRTRRDGGVGGPPRRCRSEPRARDRVATILAIGAVTW